MFSSDHSSNHDGNYKCKLFVVSIELHYDHFSIFNNQPFVLTFLSVQALSMTAISIFEIILGVFKKT